MSCGEGERRVLACFVLSLSVSLSAGVSANVFQISPSNVTGLNGAELGISCYADSNPSEVRWTKDGVAVVQSGSLQPGYADGVGAITFSPLGYQHEGVYRCTAYDSAGDELFSSYPGRVRVYGESRGPSKCALALVGVTLVWCGHLPPCRPARVHFSALFCERATGRGGRVHLRRW